LVKHYPVVRVNLGKDISICENEPAKLLPGVFKNYLWSTGSTNASITVDATGLYWVKVTDNNGCAAADSINILEVFATPKNFLKDTAGICPGDELALAPAQNYVQYAWQGNVNSKLLNVYTPGTYVLTVTDNNGCRGADSIQVYLKNYCPNTIYFPNAFTPNGDTKNPTFRPIVTGNMEKFRFAVYNQYGQMIFSSNEPRRGWDGKLGGKLQSSGNYVWICEYKFVGAGAVTRKGSCLLLK
jgi:gliding motility-associated-like protein